MPPKLTPVRRRALVVATSVYEDPGLRQLRAPAQDADRLAKVLADDKIGAFTVVRVEDKPVQEIRVSIDRFLSASELHEVALVYLSCHGLLDARGELYFATTDTRKDQLSSTGLDAGWLRARLQDCRANQQLVILDCCFSGAFVKYGKGPDGATITDPVEVPVERLHGGGRGHVVLTASRATEYSLEGKPHDETGVAGSVFTSALVEGLRTGAADFDNDGVVSTHEAFHYITQQMRAVGAKQTPQQSILRSEGNIVLGYSPLGIRPMPRPAPAVPTQTRESLVEVAEMMATVPAGSTEVAHEVALDMIPDGPAGELAMLRAIHRVLDAPDALEEVVRSRPVSDVVKLVAAVRVTGLGDRAVDPLRKAALVRPVDDVVALVDAVRASAHPTDSDAVLAAVSTRPAEDVASLCVTFIRLKRTDDLKELIRWAAKVRPLDQVGDLALVLERSGAVGGAKELLYEAGQARAVKDLAELIVRSRSQNHADVVAAVLNGVRQRPMPDAAHLVVALRAAGDRATVDNILLWTQELSPEQTAQLIAGLHAEGADDEADVAVRWTGWQLDTEKLVRLVDALDEAFLAHDVSTLVAAVASGGVEKIADFAVALGVADQPTHCYAVLERAADRPLHDVTRLMALLAPSPLPSTSYKASPEADARMAAVIALTGFLVRQRGSDILQALRAVEAVTRRRLLAEVGLAATAKAVDVLCALDDAGQLDDLGPVVDGLVGREPDALVELLSELKYADRASIVERVVAALDASYPMVKLPSLLVQLERADLDDVVEALLLGLPRDRWAGLDAPTTAAQLERNGMFLRQLDAAHRRGRRTDTIAAITRYTIVVVGVLALGTAILFGGAALSSLAARPHLNWGDWAALVPTTLVVGLVLTGLTALACVGLYDHDREREAVLVGFLMAVTLIAGFTLAFFVDDLRDSGLVVRGWLAWNV